MFPAMGQFPLPKKTATKSIYAYRRKRQPEQADRRLRNRSRTGPVP